MACSFQIFPDPLAFSMLRCILDAYNTEPQKDPPLLFSLKRNPMALKILVVSLKTYCKVKLLSAYAYNFQRKRLVKILMHIL